MCTNSSCGALWEIIPTLATATLSLLTVPIIFLIYRDVQDSYGIRMEFLLTYVIANGVLIAYVIYVYWQQSTNFPGELVLAFGFMLIHCVSFFYPLLSNAFYRAKAYMRHQDMEKGHAKEKGSQRLFDAVLQDPLLFEQFRKFTVKDFSVENALFYEFSTRLILHPYPDGSPELRDFELEIFNLFISEKADFPLNLTAKTLSNIREKVRQEAFDITLYDIARREVIAMMYTDTWVRFWKSMSEGWKTDLMSRVNNSNNSNGVN